NSTINLELQALNYRHVLYSLTYNTLPNYTLDKAVQLTVQTHRQTLAFNKDPGSRISEYFETPTP
ncbi:14869_t:CDS:1, partial [Funneliformis caledonium]